VAGVSSFGFGGTNAHVILSETQSVNMKKSLYEQDVQVFTLSAKSPKSLKNLVVKYQNFLNEKSDVNLKDLCYSTNCLREHFEERTAFTVTSMEQLKEKLEAYHNKNKWENLKVGDVKKQQSKPKIVFLYSGQGAQYKQMGETLYRTSPVFKHSLIRCAKILQKHKGIRLLDVLFDKKDDSQINQTEFTQPVLFAIQYSLTQLWKTFGFTPDIVLGHSIGEYAAACEAGVLSLEDALCLVAERGQCMQMTSSNGTMAIIRAEEERVNQYLQHFNFADVTIAAVNGTDRLVISGEKVHVEEIVQLAQNEGIVTSYLNVSRAFHSPLMDPILERFAHQAEQITYQSPRIPLISNLTGRPLQNPPSATYWVHHLREAVRFKDGVEYVLANEGPCVWIEMGPTSLISLVQRLQKDQTHLLLASLDHKKQEDWIVITEGLRKLYETGQEINWEVFHAPYDHHLTDLPTYAFEKNLHWITESVSTVTGIEPFEDSSFNDLLKQQAATLENQSKVLQKYIQTLKKI
jgi:acyl transferase domain-containing protein